MAKSSRSSAVKKNNQNLKKKVFGPVETARNERQNAKLLELAQQPKPPRAEMEIEQDGTVDEQKERFDKIGRLIFHATGDAAAASTEAKEDKAAEGMSTSLTVTVPKSLSHHDAVPPTTPKKSPTATSSTDDPTSIHFSDEQLFFGILGVSTDIIGFDENGDLKLGFAL